MKKLLLTLGLFSLALTGCMTSGGGEGYTDEDDKFLTFEFVKKYSDTEKKAVLENVKNNILNLSSVTFEETKEVDNDLQKETVSKKGSNTFYNDSNQNRYICYTVYEEATKNEEQGIILDESVVSATNEWDTGKNVLASREDRTVLGKNTSKVKADQYSGSAKDKKKSMYESYLYGITGDGIDLYEDKDGNTFFIKSSKQKTVNPVQYGEGTKDEVTFQYNQDIYKISDNHLVSYTSYARTKTNRDSKTKDWYSDIKSVSTTYVSRNYLYEARQSGSVENLNNSIKDYVSFDEIEGSQYVASATGASTSEMTLTPSSYPSSEIAYTVIEQDNERYETVKFDITLDRREKDPNTDIYTFNNAAVQFKVVTRLGAGNKETNNYKIFDNDYELSSGAKEYLKLVKGSDGLYYIVNISNSDVRLTYTLKFTSSNYVVNELLYEVVE